MPVTSRSVLPFATAPRNWASCAADCGGLISKTVRDGRLPAAGRAKGNRRASAHVSIRSCAPEKRTPPSRPRGGVRTVVVRDLLLHAVQVLAALGVDADHRADVHEARHADLGPGF